MSTAVLHCTTVLAEGFSPPDITAAVWALALIAACLEEAKVKTLDRTPLDLGVDNYASVLEADTLIAAWPGAINEVDEYGGTPLHTRATVMCLSLDERRHTNVLCFMLVHHRASLAAINDKRQTPAAAAAGTAGFGGDLLQRLQPPNYHLRASFDEIVSLKKQPHLSLMRCQKHQQRWDSRV